MLVTFLPVESWRYNGNISFFIFAEFISKVSNEKMGVGESVAVSYAFVYWEKHITFTDVW